MHMLCCETKACFCQNFLELLGCLHLKMPGYLCSITHWQQAEIVWRLHLSIFPVETVFRVEAICAIHFSCFFFMIFTIFCLTHHGQPVLPVCQNLWSSFQIFYGSNWLVCHLSNFLCYSCLARHSLMSQIVGLAVNLSGLATEFFTIHQIYQQKIVYI